MSRRDFRTPASLPLETTGRCIIVPNDSAWLGLLNAALLMLTEQWRYDQVETTDLTPEETAAIWYDIYVSTLTSNCEDCSDMLLRQNPTNPCQLERSDDNGETWVMFADVSLCMSGTPQPPETVEYPDDMRIEPVTGNLQYSLDGGETWYDYPTPTTLEPTQPYTPPRETPAGATDEERRCAAASSAAVALNQMYEQTYGAIAAGLANAWGTFSNFMNDLTDFVFGITYGQVWDIVKIIGLWEPIDFETNYAAPSLGSEAIDALTCLIYDNTTIDQNGHSQIDFGAVRDNVISELGINPGTAVWTHLNYLQEAGLERIADVGFGTTGCTCEDYGDIDYEPFLRSSGGSSLVHLGGNWWRATSRVTTGNHKLAWGYRRKSDLAEGACGRIYALRVASGPYTLDQFNPGMNNRDACSCSGVGGFGGATGNLVTGGFPSARHRGVDRFGDKASQFAIDFLLGPCTLPT